MIIKPNKSQWKFNQSRHLGISTLDTVELEENNRILLRKVNFSFMIPKPSLDCSYVVLTLAKFEPRSVVARRREKHVLNLVEKCLDKKCP